MEREEIEEELINYYLTQKQFCIDTFSFGCVGFSKYTLKKLKQEYKEILGDSKLKGDKRCKRKKLETC